MIGIIFILVVLLALYSFMIHDLIKKIGNNTYEKESFEELFQAANALIIPVNYENKVLYFFVDTGSTCNIIKEEFAATLPKELIKPIKGGSKVTGAGGTFSLSEEVTLNIEVLNNKFKTRFEIMPIDSALKVIETNAKKSIAGILGTHFLHENHLIIDYSKKQILLNTNS